MLAWIRHNLVSCAALLCLLAFSQYCERAHACAQAYAVLSDRDSDRDEVLMDMIDSFVGFGARRGEVEEAIENGQNLVLPEPLQQETRRRGWSENVVGRIYSILAYQGNGGEALSEIELYSLTLYVGESIYGRDSRLSVYDRFGNMGDGNAPSRQHVPFQENENLTQFLAYLKVLDGRFQGSVPRFSDLSLKERAILQTLRPVRWTQSMNMTARRALSEPLYERLRAWLELHDPLSLVDQARARMLDEKNKLRPAFTGPGGMLRLADELELSDSDRVERVYHIGKAVFGRPDVKDQSGELEWKFFGGSIGTFRKVRRLAENMRAAKRYRDEGGYLRFAEDFTNGDMRDAYLDASSAFADRFDQLNWPPMRVGRSIVWRAIMRVRNNPTDFVGQAGLIRATVLTGGNSTTPLYETLRRNSSIVGLDPHRDLHWPSTELTVYDYALARRGKIPISPLNGSFKHFVSTPGTQWDELSARQKSAVGHYLWWMLDNERHPALPTEEWGRQLGFLHETLVRDIFQGQSIAMLAIKKRGEQLGIDVPLLDIRWSEPPNEEVKDYFKEEACVRYAQWARLHPGVEPLKSDYFDMGLNYYRLFAQGIYAPGSEYYASRIFDSRREALLAFSRFLVRSP